MLKPDAVARKLAPDISAALEASGLTIVATRNTRLNRHDVERFFVHRTPAYCDFLTEGDVCILLIEGPNAHESLYDLKHQLRQTLGAKDRMRNLVHAVEYGVEYHRMLASFFDQDARTRCNAVDLDLRLRPHQDALQTLMSLDQGSGLRYCSVTIDRDDRGRLAPLIDSLASYSWSSIQFCVGTMLSFDGPRPTTAFVHHPLCPSRRWDKSELRRGTSLESLSSACDGIISVEVEVTPDEIRTYAQDSVRLTEGPLDEKIRSYALFRDVATLRDQGAHRLYCARPDWSPKRCDLLSEVARLTSMGVTGGSAGVVTPGLFSLSHRALFEFDMEAA